MLPQGRNRWRNEKVLINLTDILDDKRRKKRTTKTEEKENRLVIKGDTSHATKSQSVSFWTTSVNGK